MNLCLTRAEAIEHEILKPLSEGLEDLLSEPLPGSHTHPTVEDYYDVQAIADEVLELYVFEGGFVYHCPGPTSTQACSGRSPRSTRARRTPDRPRPVDGSDPCHPSPGAWGLHSLRMTAYT